MPDDSDPEPLTLELVRARVAEIAACRHDDEVAHSLEDKLRADVLRALAPREPLAAAALETETIDFSRWCA
jgi:hypothetical protein